MAPLNISLHLSTSFRCEPTCLMMVNYSVDRVYRHESMACCPKVVDICQNTKELKSAAPTLRVSVPHLQHM